MSRQFHLIFDAVGQLLLLAAFIYLLIGYTPDKNALLGNWRFFALFTAIWQCVNAVISTRVYENPLRKPFLRMAGWSILWLAIAVGALYFIIVIILSFQSIASMLWVISVVEIVFKIISWSVPIAFTALISWYYYLTAKDIYIITNKTI